jgi:RNA polymerase sigma factor (sigma-70 family)
MELGEPAVNESASDRPPACLLELAHWVDEVCERFEAALQSGGRPRLEDYLAGAPEPQRTELLHELILLEVEYGRRQGEPPQPDRYLSRFPDLDAQWLAGALQALAAPAAGRAASRVEMKLRVQEALDSMDAHDREVLILRHFEELSNAEAARVLGIKPSAAVNRYVRALKRLKDVFQGMPGGIEALLG